MKMSRRDSLLGSAVSLLAGKSGFGQGVTPPPAQPQTPRAPQTRLLEALQRSRLPIAMGESPSGPGWDFLVREARGAHFTLIGERHGVAETARFSSALFKALRPAGYVELPSSFHRRSRLTSRQQRDAMALRES